MFGLMLLLDNLVFLVQLNPSHDKGAHTEIKIKLILIKSVKLTEAHVMQNDRAITGPPFTVFPYMMIPIPRIRLSWGRLILRMGPVKRHTQKQSIKIHKILYYVYTYVHYICW